MRFPFVGYSCLLRCLNILTYQRIYTEPLNKALNPQLLSCIENETNVNVAYFCFQIVLDVGEGFVNRHQEARDMNKRQTDNGQIYID